MTQVILGHLVFTICHLLDKHQTATKTTRAHPFSSDDERCWMLLSLFCAVTPVYLFFFLSLLYLNLCLCLTCLSLCHFTGTGTCQSPGSCPYHPVKEKKSHQHATCLDSDQPLQSSSLANTGTTGLTGMRKSSSLENLDCLMQDLQKLQLAPQSDGTTNTGQTTAMNRMTGANHLTHSGPRAATLRVSRGSRVKNESFRAAVDRSYDAVTSGLTMHPQQQPHQLGLFHHQAVTDPSNMETGELLASLLNFKHPDQTCLPRPYDELDASSIAFPFIFFAFNGLLHLMIL